MGRRPLSSLATTESPTLQGALEDGLGKAVVARDMPGPCKFPSLCQLPAEVAVDLAPHAIAGIMLQAADAETVPPR